MPIIVWTNGEPSGYFGIIMFTYLSKHVLLGTKHQTIEFGSPIVAFQFSRWRTLNFNYIKIPAQSLCFIVPVDIDPSVFNPIE